MSGSGSANVVVPSDSTGVTTGQIATTGTGTIAPMGAVSLNGNISAYGTEFSVGYSGQMVLTGANGSLTIAVSGSSALLTPQSTSNVPTSADLNYNIVSGTGIYQDLVDYGTLQLTLTSTPPTTLTTGTYSGTFTGVFTSAASTS